MKAKKGLLAAATMAVTALALSACSGGSLGNSTGASSTGTGSAGSSSVAGKVTLGNVGEQSQIQNISAFCGTKPIKVAYADGSGNNAWRKTTQVLFQDEAKKCPNVTVLPITDAQDNTQKAISDLNSLAAQGANVIVTFADAGPAILPTVQKLTKSGVKVVPIVSGIGGKPGTDYVDFVSEDVQTYGQNLGRWTMKTMGGKGNLVMLGGVAGSAYSQTVYDGVKLALKDYPNIKLLNTDGPVVTNWTVDQTQQAVAGLITKYGKIDGVVADYGGGSAGGVQAFINAGKPVPVWSANDSNAFACLYEKYKSSQPTFKIATESSRNWVVLAALHKGLAAYNGLADDEPSIFNLGIIEDSTNPAKQPRCDKKLGPDAILSSGLSESELAKLAPAQ